MYGYGYRYNSGLVIGAGGGAPFANTYSLSLDGVDDYVSLGNITELNNTSTFTYSGWYKQTALNQQNFMFASEVDINNYIAAYTWTDGFMYIANYVGGPSYAQFYYSPFVTAGQWFHFAYVFDGSAVGNANRVKVYIDGVLISLTFTGTIPSTTPIGTNISSIGKMNFYAQTWNGGIDECAFFSDAKTQSEITDIYNLGTPTDLSLLSTPPLHWYRNGDNGSWKSPQWLIPNNENKDKVSNYSMDFDGVGDYVIAPLDGTATGGVLPAGDSDINLTISLWFKKNDTGQKGIFQWANKLTDGTPFVLIQSLSNAYRILLDGVYQSISFISVGDWINFIVTRNSLTNIWTGYHNGLVVFTYDDGGTALSNRSSAQDIYLGNGFGGYFNGSIDEVAIWDTDETANIATIYNSGTPTTISGAVAHWKMADNSTFATNWTVPDEVGTNNGTSANMTIEDRIGEAPNSSNNALSLNMDEVDVVPDVPN